MSFATRAIALLFLSISLAFALASLTSTTWVTDRNVSTYSQHVDFGLQSWSASWTSPTSQSITTGSQPYTSTLYTQLGLDVYLDTESAWRSAGLAALALGALGVAFNGISLLVVLSSLIRPTSTYLATFPAFLSGFAFILGAVLYEGLRPSFHGDIGYQWPMGLFITSGVASDIAAYALHFGSASDRSTPASRGKL
jgi:hypothetical protein